MKLRILKTNNIYYIQKRIFKFLMIEWWIIYKNCPLSFNTFEQAKERIDLIRKEREEIKNKKKYSKPTEILRFDV